MIRADQIPDAVREAYLAEEYRTGSIEAAIAAALSAWPGAWRTSVEYKQNRLHLPLPAEKRDEPR